MYNIKIYNFEKKYLLDELIKIFLKPEDYRILDDKEITDDMLEINRENFSDRNEIKRQIYDELSALTNQNPEWGILTGIRPVKLCGEKFAELGSREETVNFMQEYYYLDEAHANMIMDMYDYQMEAAGPAEEKSASLYIGIPFCPTRCVYCSFASNQVADSEISKYMVSLNTEIKRIGKLAKEKGFLIESVYVGGGTPTTLSAEQLDEMIGNLYESFDLSGIKEFTVEAGRPDTITKEKLLVLKKHNVGRISINPQTMKKKTLELIGRNHTPEQIREAFKLAFEVGFESINADIIAGLPGEELEDFRNTLNEIIDLGPDNITVHSLAVKKASRLIDIDKNYHYKKALLVSDMLDASKHILRSEDYLPYYLYRQKHMAGAYENTGYCKKGKEGIYNIRIMDEHQAIIALGAGAISKSYYPSENRLERVPNVTNYEEYINRVEEMISRKEKEIFRR